jgi:hypothetical protein
MKSFLQQDSVDSGPQSSHVRNDGYDKNFPKPSRDEFSSKGGSYIKLGNHKSTRAAPAIRAYDTSLISHSLGSTSSQSYLQSDTGKHMIHDSSLGAYSPSGGLKDTKFGGGFQRMRETDIKNPAKEEVDNNMALSAARAEIRRESRALHLYKSLEQNGFDVITGQPKQRIVPPRERSTGKKSIIPVVSDEIAANSRIFLRESEGRFHMPQPSGVKHEYRQKVLKEGGISKQCMSGVLMAGKADIPSHGIEDNFSMSMYPASQPQDPTYRRMDLPEMRSPGRYCPTKQPGHPSGNPELVKGWGSGMDINNKALRGKL